MYSSGDFLFLAVKEVVQRADSNRSFDNGAAKHGKGQRGACN